MYRKARIGYHKSTWVPLRTSNGFTEWSLVCSKPLVQNLYIYNKIKNSTFQVSSLDHPTSRWNKFLTITPNNAKLEPLERLLYRLSNNNKNSQNEVRRGNQISTQIWYQKVGFVWVACAKTDPLRLEIILTMCPIDGYSPWSSLSLMLGLIFNFSINCCP